MTLESVVVVIIAVALLVYLLYTLLRPERF